MHILPYVFYLGHTKLEHLDVPSKNLTLVSVMTVQKHLNKKYIITCTPSNWLTLAKYILPLFYFIDIYYLKEMIRWEYSVLN